MSSFKQSPNRKSQIRDDAGLSLKFELEIDKASYLEIDEIVEKFMRNLSETTIKNHKGIQLIKGTQLRKIHEHVTKIRRLHQELGYVPQTERSNKLKECERELARFKYFLAYQKARIENKQQKVFGPISEWFRKSAEIIMKNIHNVHLSKELIEKMYITSEAILAYHKYYGGGD